MAGKRRYLDGDDSGPQHPHSPLDPFMGFPLETDRADLPPDPGYTGTPNESLANTRSKGHLAVADMSPNNGGGDIKEGVSYRTRMANQAPQTFFDEDQHG